METVSGVGKGYYNYYEINSRHKTKDNKAIEVWYDRDLSSEEINSNNSNMGCSNRESQGADICRKVADSFQSIAASNRAKYSDPEEMKSAVWAKYQASGKYNHLSFEQRTALARTEINMTMYGYVNLSEAREIAGISGEVTKNKMSGSDAEDRAFNKKMLGNQIANVFKNNGISLSLLNGRSLKFSVDGMTEKLSVALIGADDGAEDLISKIESALNTNDNAKKLFFNLLYDSSKKGLIPSDQMAKWKLFSDFKNITGMDIRDFKQNTDGFVNSEGRYAKDIYKEALKGTKKVPAEFKGVAFDYYSQLEKDAMKYDIANVPDLSLSLSYKDGNIVMPGERQSFDMSV